MAYLYCPDASLDSTTGQCSVDTQWINGMPGGLPPLSIQDGFAISAAIGGCWALAYTWRLIRYAMRGRI